MKARKTFVAVVCILLCIIFILSISVMVIVPALASSSDIQAEIDALTAEKSVIEEEIDAIEVQLSSLGDQKDQTLEKKEILDEKNALAQEELDVIQEQIDIIDNYMANRQADLEAARLREQEQEDAWLERLRAMEENSDLTYLQVLFDATSFSDLLTRLDLVNEISEYDEQLFNDYIAARQTVEELEAEAEEMAIANEANKAELEDKKVQLESDIAAANALISELESSIDGYNYLMEQTEAEEEALASEIAAKQAEYEEVKAEEEAAARLAAQLAAAAAGADTSATDLVISSSDGSFLWPSYTTLITSYFGYRESPGGIGSTNHKGVDIGAPYGSAIYASASGTVTLACYYGGYGNCVTIAHGNGYSTLYGHMSAIAVSEGQYVEQGQVIGYCGSTGNSTGPHIHFSIIDSSGTFLNPLSFSFIYAG